MDDKETEEKLKAAEEEKQALVDEQNKMKEEFEKWKEQYRQDHEGEEPTEDDRFVMFNISLLIVNIRVPLKGKLPSSCKTCLISREMHLVSCFSRYSSCERPSENCQYIVVCGIKTSVSHQRLDV